MKNCFVIFLVGLCFVLFCSKAMSQDQSAPATGFADGKSLKIETPKGWKISTPEIGKAMVFTISPETSHHFRIRVTAIPLGKLKPGANTPEQLKVLTQQMSQSMIGEAEEKVVVINEAKIDKGTAYYFHLTDKNLKAGERKYLTQLVLGIDEAVIFMTFTSIEKDSEEQKLVFEMVKTIRLAKVSHT